MSKRGEELREKEARAVLRQCLDKERTHIKAGNWRNADGAKLTLIGHAKKLHGTVCNCCRRR